MATLTGRILYERKLPSGVVISSVGNKTLDSETKIAKNFVLRELANNMSTDMIKFIINNDVVKHIEMMQELRDRLGRPINVTSWYRTKEFNSRPGINGAANSLHLLGLATDCWFATGKGKSKKPMDEALYKDIEKHWMDICKEHNVIGGINRYTDGVHLSSREDKFGYKHFVKRDYRGKK